MSGKIQFSINWLFGFILTKLRILAQHLLAFCAYRKLEMKLKCCLVVFLIFFTLKLQGHADDHSAQPPTRVERGTYYYYYSYDYSNNNYYYYNSYYNNYYYNYYDAYDNYYSYETDYDYDYNHTEMNTFPKRITVIFISAFSVCCFFVCAPCVGCICVMTVAMLVNSRNSRRRNSAPNAPPYVSPLHNSPYAYPIQPVQTQMYPPLPNAPYPGQPLPNNPMDPDPPSYNTYHTETYQYIGFPN